MTVDAREAAAVMKASRDTELIFSQVCGRSRRRGKKTHTLARVSLKRRQSMHPLQLRGCCLNCALSVALTQTHSPASPFTGLQHRLKGSRH